MAPRNRKILIVLFAVFALALAVLAIQFHAYTERYAIQEAEKLVQDALLTHRAIHKYVTKVSRPELYRLKREGKLYEEYFSPMTMSFTYQARGIKDFLNQERKKVDLPEIYFKLASTNPRNEINRADEREAQLLKRMNEGELEKFREITEDEQGLKTLYVAVATDPITKGCLKCHGTPEEAPTEMVAQYPGAAGYYEKAGDIRALISIRVPLETHLADGNRIADILTWITLAVLALIYGLIAYFVRHTDRQQQIILSTNKTLEQLSVTDYLTGIHNRMGFINYAEQAFAAASRYKQPFSLIMFDVDHFKRVNDTHGHHVGDKVLQQLAQLVKDRLRSSDILGRFGGEEFMIATIEQDEQGARTLAEELRAAAAAYLFDDFLRLTVSFGVVQLSDESDLSELIRHVDEALYRSKNEGRNRVSVNAKRADNVGS